MPAKKSFTSRLASDSAIYGLGNIISKMVSVFLVPIYTRVFSRADYGLVAIAGVLFSLLSIFLNLGTSSALFRYYNQAADDDERKSYVTSSVVLLLVTGVVICGSGWLLAPRIASLVFPAASYAVYVRVVAVWTFASLLSIVPLAIFRAERKAPLFIAVTLTTFLLNVALTVILVVFMHKGPLGSLWANVAASAIVGVALIPFLITRMKAIPKRRHVLEILSFGLPLVPFGLGMLVLNMGDRMFLKNYHGLGEVGLYSLGYTAGMVVNLVLVQPFQTAWWPLVFESEKEPGAAERLGRVLTYFLFVGLGLALAIGVMAKEVIHIIARPAFWSAYTVTFWVALAYVMFGVFYCVSVGSLLSGKSRAFTPLALIGAGTALISYQVLIPPYGRTGAAIATLISFFVMAVAGYFFSRRAYEIPYEWGRIAKLALVTAIVFVALSLLPVQSVLGALALKVVLMPTMYLGGLWLVRFFRPAEFAMARQTLGRARAGVLPAPEVAKFEEVEESLDTTERL